MNKHSLLLLPAMLLSSAAMAETVSPEQALDKALQFLQQPARARGQQAPSLTLTHTAAANGETYYYVFNNAAGGYVIVGGDDVAYDVLAYGEGGTFDADQLPPAMTWLLGLYERQIHSVIVSDRQGTTMRRAAARTESEPEIEPLLGATEWNQCLPYSANIMGSGQMENRLERYATGCVATAMAQVMRYWQYPERGMGQHSYQVNGNLLEANFANSEYRWDLMQDKYPEAYSGTPEEDAVALLMSDLGIALNMQYGRYFTTGSGTNSFAIPYVLRTFFGYDGGVMAFQRDKYELEPGEWEEILYEELSETGPIIYNGADPEGAGGHSFVCDGYKDGLFHINWGWAGRYNDYFRLTPTADKPALNPDGDDIGGNGTMNYSADQTIIAGIMPDPESQGFLYATERATIPAVMSPKEPLHIVSKLYNPTDETFVGGIEFALIDKQGLFIDTTLMRSIELQIAPHEEAAIEFDYEAESLKPGVTYQALFIAIDFSDLQEELPEPRAWFYEIDEVHVEGPEWVLVPMTKGYNVVSVPFDYKLDDDVVAYAATGINEDNEVVLKPVSRIEAGGCYVLVGEPSPMPVIMYGMPVTDEVWAEDPIFVGNMTSEYQLMNEDSYAFANAEDGPYFWRQERADGVAPHSAVIKGTAAEADILLLNFQNVTTGIQEVGLPRCILSHNIMGQPLHQSRGLMISNGHITFVK